jgi:hypothetical protein
LAALVLAGSVGAGAADAPDNRKDTYPFVVKNPSSWVFAGTGLRVDSPFGQEIVGYETDALVFDPTTNRPTGVDGSPNNFQILARADLTSWGTPVGGCPLGWAVMGLFDYGGTVFNAGTIEWAAALTSDEEFSGGRAWSRAGELRDKVIVKITANVINRLSQPRTAAQKTTMSVHEYYASSPTGGLKFHFSTDPFVERGWLYNRPAFFAFRTGATTGTVPVWQYQVADGGGLRFHYSTDPAVASGWTRSPDQPVFYAYPEAGTGRLPVYEYHYRQPDGGDRFYYSTDPNVSSGWTKLGVKFFVPSAN